MGGIGGGGAPVKGWRKWWWERIRAGFKWRLCLGIEEDDVPEEELTLCIILVSVVSPPPPILIFWDSKPKVKVRNFEEEPKP